jgi:Ca2+-binding EF-hand superfamily protein
MRLAPPTVPILVLFLGGLSTAPAYAQEDARPPAAPTPAERFADLDKNSDGKLTREEVGEEQRRFFSRLVRVADADEDGTLTREEFTRGLAEPAPRQPMGQGFGGERGRNEFGEFLRRIDGNGDGKIARDELKVLPEGVRERFGLVFERAGKDSLTFDELRQAMTRAGGNPDPGAMFDRLDANGDGKLSLQELPEPARQRFRDILQQAGKGEDAALTKEEVARIATQLGNRPPGPPVFFAKLDQNRDGSLSKEELARAPEMFAELDANSDGRLEPGELFRPAGMPGRAQAGAGPQRGEFLTRFLKENDRNADGKLSKDEAPERMRANFERIDRNSDSTLDTDELRQAFARRRERQQRD